MRHFNSVLRCPEEALAHVPMYYQQYSARQYSEQRFATRPVAGSPQQTTHQLRHSASAPKHVTAAAAGAAFPPSTSADKRSQQVVGSGVVGGAKLAHSASQSSMQAVPVNSGAPVSPQMQLRGVRCSGQPPLQSPTKEPVMVRAVATPLRAEEVADWSVSSVRRLCNEGEESQFLGKVRLLEKQLACSVPEAVDSLNRRLIWCPEDCCVVHCPGDGYYLLYRTGKWESACAQLNTSVDGAAPAGSPTAPSHSGGGLSARTRSDGRTSSAGPMAVETTRSGGQTGSGCVPAEAVVSRQSSHTALERASPVSSGALPGHSPVVVTPVVSAAAAAAAAASSAQAQQRGKPPPLQHGLTRTPSARSTTEAGFPRYASPAARVVQPYQSQAPHSARSSGSSQVIPQGGARAAGGAVTPTPPPPAAVVEPTAARRVPSAGPKQAPVGAKGIVVHATEPQAAAVQVVPAAAHRLSTPRENLERELTDPEKIKFSDLEFVESLGSGEFGQVFRGKYKGCEVAIKQLYWDDTMTELVMTDLAKEIESFRHLRHKRLVRFIGACLEMPHPCLVTEYMPGGSLHHLLHVRKLHLPLLHALNMCLQIADGVIYLHSQTPTVVHRDLKSLNVVLDLSLNIKICDFGLTEPMERTHITKKNNGGSPRYMAPELFDSKTKITEKIDVWAMGCIFVEICGGPLPYETISTLADLTREMLVNKKTPDVPHFIPPEVRVVICACLAFDYRNRPTSKGAFEQLQAAKKQLRKDGVL